MDPHGKISPCGEGTCDLLTLRKKLKCTPPYGPYLLQNALEKMSRHSKNQGAMGSMMTYHEFKKLGHGTQSARYGVDSQLPFGYCCLSLGPVQDPLVSPSGHVYSREAIMEYLLEKTQELKRQQDLYDAQQEAMAAKADEKLALESSADAAAFVSKQLMITGPSAPAKKRKREEVEASAKTTVVNKLNKKVGDSATRDDLKRTSFWVPEFTPEHVEAKIPLPPKRPPSPMSGEPLRLKVGCGVNDESLVLRLSLALRIPGPGTSRPGR